MKRFLVISIALVSLGWFTASQVAAADVGGILGHAARGDVGGAVAHGLGAPHGGHWGGYGGRHWGNYNPYYSRNYYSPYLGYSYYYPYYSSYYHYPYYNYSNPYSSGYGYGYPSPNAGGGGPIESGPRTSAFWPQGAEAAAPGPGLSGSEPTGPVRILNPASNEAALSFTVNGQRYSVPPGHHQDLPAAAGQVIEFHRGGNRGPARYSLQGGLYTFTPTDQGWELYHTSPTLPDQEGGGQGQPPQQSFQNPPAPQR